MADTKQETKAEVTLDTDLTTITTDQLETHQRRLWDRSTACDRERERRQALPWVWKAEEETVAQIRKALGKPATRGADKPEPWEKPTSPIDAYVKGDRVTHDGKNWVATGSGMILTAPGVTDPIQYDLWRTAEPAPTAETA
ncbi:MAG: hypothetical protein SPK00_10370 [Corynebacterium glucuronolyticum]|nr:hypothetical protein [Mycobacteriaceae bacterium]MDY5835129.1 hypothetical protein [Corynebacterium glucuronolyticum]